MAYKIVEVINKNLIAPQIATHAKKKHYTIVINCYKSLYVQNEYSKGGY